MTAKIPSVTMIITIAVTTAEVAASPTAEALRPHWIPRIQPAMATITPKTAALKMPSPKSGTVTPDVAKAVTEFKAGKVEFRTDAGGNVHAPLGKRSFSVDDLTENMTAFLNHLIGMRPAAVKGQFFRKISVSTTMGPGAWISYES